VFALTGELLLRTWEQGALAPEAARPLTLLAAAMPDGDPQALAEIALADRNRLLLRLRELTFGSELRAVADCSDCAATLEVSLPVAELVPAGEADRSAWTEAGHRFALRAATTADLLATLAAPDLERAEELMLARCLTVDPPVAPGERLGSEVRARFEALHALAEVRLMLVCPECGREQVLDLDIARFLWTELRRAATQLLREIHTLATGTGWSESEILAMSPQRRAAYLELVGS
jgi:hypothetical protein